MSLITRDELQVPINTTDGQYTHYLYSFVSPAPPLADPNVLTNNISAALENAGVPITMGMAYVAPMFGDPRSVGLVDVWYDLSDDDKLEFTRSWPAVAAAITLICGPKE